MKIKDAASIVAERLGMDKEFVYKVYMGYWKSMRNILSSIPLKECDGEPEEYLKGIRSSVSIPYIGKLYVPSEIYKKIILKKREYEIKKDKTLVYQGNNNC